MASTKKKATTVKEKPSLILSSDEHRMVAMAPLEVENSKLLMAIEEQSLRNMILEHKLLEAKIEKQKQMVNEYHLKYTSEKNRYSGIISGIMKNHGLENEKFSYNNDTGEIIL